MTHPNYNVLIRLDSERNSIEFSERDELIHQKELDQVIGLIEGSLFKASDYNNLLNTNTKIKRLHDTITLSGGRGSGKTTFILSLFNLIKNDKLPKGKRNYDYFSKDLEILDILDPTLIEEKGHIFLNIIAKIKERVEAEYRISKYQHKKSDISIDSNFTAWESSLKELAEGLPCIDGIGLEGLKQVEWHDSEFVMDLGIHGVTAANNLEKNFHIYVSKSLKFLNKKAFLLAFDDVDTNFSKGMPVLDTLHKYLTTPQIITILSGDLSLYSLLVRKKQWENIGNILFNIECEKGGEYENYETTVTRIEEQYFQKLLNPERRIYLSTLFQKEESSDYLITIISTDNNEDNINGIETDTKITRSEFRRFYDQILKKLGIKDGRQERYFYQFLASLPIRTQKQFMFLMSRNQNHKLGILELFWNDLAARNIDVPTLRDHPEITIALLLKYLVKQEIFNEGYSFRPIFNNAILNGAQFGAGVLLSLGFNDSPSYIFEYWLRIGLTRDLNFLFDQSSESEVSPKFQLDDFIDHCALLSRRKTSHLARMIVSYIRGIQSSIFSRTDKEIKPWLGTIPLYSQSNKNEFSLKKALGIQKDEIVETLGYLPFSIVTNHRGFNLSVYSIYSLLGVIGEVLEYLDTTHINSIDSPQYTQASKGVIKILKKNAQPRYYPLPKISRLRGAELPDFNEDEEVSFHEEDSFLKMEVLANNIVKWYLNKSKIEIHPYLAAKIFTRFFYVLGRIDNSCHKTNVGDWLHRMIIAFLNSVLVEEFLENINTGELAISLKNPVESDRIFIDNLNNIASLNSNIRLEFSVWIFSCPLWRYFLSTDDISLTNSLVKFCQSSINVKHKIDDPSTSIYAPLSNVPIYRSMEKRTFSVSKKECTNYFMEVFSKAKISLIEIEGMSEVDFYYLVQDLVGDRYNVQMRSMKSLKARLIKGLI